MSVKLAFKLPNQLTLGNFRLLLGVLWLALVVPSLFLIYQTRDQLQWESFYHYRGQATELAQRLDRQLQALIATEEARPYVDYQFLVMPDAKNNFSRRSPLAQYPVQSELPGVVGYFQLDANGSLTSPVVPLSNKDADGISDSEMSERLALRDKLLAVLAENDVLKQRQRQKDQPAVAGRIAAENAISSTQRAFNVLAETKQAPKKSLDAETDQIKGLKLDQSLQKSVPAPQVQAAPLSKHEARKEKVTLADELLPAQAASADKSQREGKALPGQASRVHTFESEVDPFDLMRLENGYFLLFRNVWHQNNRVIQGILLDEKQFLNGALAQPFLETGLAQLSQMGIAYQGQLIKTISLQSGQNNYGDRLLSYDASSSELKGTMLEQARLYAPLGSFQLLWAIEKLPLGPGAKIVAWSSIILFSVLCIGFWGLYRLGVRQIKLVNQQQNFVSAVSHELKTPLTSIRMYSEILREGWLTDDKKMQYYTFIHDESERLSRLITNVLQLARLGRKDLHLDLKPVAVAELIDMLRSRIMSSVERAGFTLSIRVQEDCKNLQILVDADAITQIIINLIDNAIKFSANDENKTIDLSVGTSAARNEVIWRVRDYGKGISVAESRRVFELFYRGGDELTREATGTGIGLALVKQLVEAMGGTIGLNNAKPGAEFIINFNALP